MVVPRGVYFGRVMEEEIPPIVLGKEEKDGSFCRVVVDVAL